MEVTWLSGHHRDEKLRFQKVFCPHENEKPAFFQIIPACRALSKSCGFREGLVWTEVWSPSQPFFWMSRNTPPSLGGVLRDIPKETAAKETSASPNRFQSSLA